MFHFYVHIILVGFLFLGFPRVGVSQILTDCRTLSTMVEDAVALGLSLKPEQRILDLTNYCPNVSAHLDWRNGYLTDMRLRLFPLEEDSKYSQVVLRFLERYLLALVLKGNPSEQQDLLRQDFVKLYVSGRDYATDPSGLKLAVSRLVGISSFTLQEDSLLFEAKWLQGNTEVLQMRFPKQYDLILGKDKKELTALFIEDLSCFLGEKISTLDDSNHTAYLWYENLFEKITGSYILPQVKSGSYIQKTSIGNILLFREDFPNESMLNLFTQADVMDKNFTLDLVVKGYTYYSQTKCPLSKFSSYMRNIGCQTYVGMETVEKEKLTGTVFYVNRQLMYEHMLYFEFPRHLFKQVTGEFSVQLYPYIPIGNIGNLYDGETK